MGKPALGRINPLLSLLERDLSRQTKKGGKKMDEVEELLEEGKVCERKLCQIKKRLIVLSKMHGIEIDLDNWKNKSK